MPSLRSRAKSSMSLTGLGLLAVDAIREVDIAAAPFPGNAKAKRERLASRRPPMAFLITKRSRIPALKSHVPCAPDLSVSPDEGGVKSR